ncbi:flagellar protein FlaG [Pseudomonas sediminis]|uniref:flagellar protein FlaG n=1 Tax=Pseudomonas sediminis TaxID=1691904 RepID=UPI00244A7BD3|nr:flagellar protein FlaG [Pseudomonas sediminis]MDG9757393.1 flagellar protein FlaG [Pseudomonas sediminis]
MTITSVTPIGSLTPSARQVAGAAVERPRQSGENPQAAEAVANVPREQLESSMQSAMQSIRRDINFQVDDSTGRVVVQVVDGGSGEVVRQIPSEVALSLAARLEDMRSLLFREEA